MYQNILLALDDSPTADLVLHEALKLAETGCKITAVTVIENPLPIYGLPNVMYGTSDAAAFSYEDMQEIAVLKSTNILNKAKSDAEQLGNIQIETHLIHSDPMASPDIASAIEKAAKKYHADLIVIGTHGRSGIARLLLGSVSEQLIRQSRLPVLLIRSQTDESDK